MLPVANALFVAVLVVILGIAGYTLQRGTWSEIAQRRRTASWPSVDGVVTGARLIVHRGSSRPGSRGANYVSYSPLIQYSYDVNGRTFSGSRYQNGYISRGEEWVTTNREAAEQIVAAHSPGSPVTVRYDPAGPECAYLAINDEIQTLRINQVLGVLLLVVAAGLLVFGVLGVLGL